ACRSRPSKLTRALPRAGFRSTWSTSSTPSPGRRSSASSCSTPRWPSAPPRSPIPGTSATATPSPPATPASRTRPRRSPPPTPRKAGTTSRSPPPSPGSSPSQAVNGKTSTARSRSPPTPSPSTPNPSNPVSSTATSPSTRTRIPGFPHAPPTPKAPATRTPPTAPSDPVDDREHYPGRVYVWRLNAQLPPQIRPHLSPAVYTDGMRASDRAYTTLSEEIVEGTLEPGTVLGEVEQSARLGISRTPLREALSRLTANGLAAPSRGRGLVVTAVSLDEAPHLFDLRIALETLAARRAAERAAHRPGPTATAGTHS